jgi:hypothetical protein
LDENNYFRRSTHNQAQTSSSISTSGFQSSQKSINQIQMSQVAAVADSEVVSAIINAENTDPNAESVAVLKKTDESAQLLISSENLRSESSTPVKEIPEDQPVATTNAGNNNI